MPIGDGAVVASARVLLRTDNAELKRGLQESNRLVDQSARGMGSALASTAKAFAFTAGAAGIGAFVLGVKHAVTASSDLGEQVNKTNVVFRDSAGDVQQWSTTTAAALGVSRRAALEYTGVFGNMLVPMGLARREAAGMSMSLVQLAADMASFNNASPEEVLEALRAGLSGESEPLRRFGIFLNEARIQQEALNLGLSDGVGKLDAAAKAQAIYSLILKDSKDAQGDFARTSDSLANQQRILRAELENLAAALGTRLVPLLADGIGELTDWIHGIQNSESAQRRLNAVMDTAEEILAGVIETGDELAPILEGIARAADDVAQIVGGWDTAFQLILTGVLVSKLGKLTGAFTTLAGAEAAAAAGGVAASGVGIAGAAGQAGRLLRMLRALSLIGAITIAIELVIDTPDWLPKGPSGLDLLRDLTDFARDHGGGTTPSGRTPGRGPGVSGKQADIARTAIKLGPGSGATYVFGRESIETGYDCSGYIYDVYRRHGVRIPRTAAGQFRDPNAIDTTGEEKPGDGVYFDNGTGYQASDGPPDHCGIYVGSGQFIEYFSEGKPARVNNLRSRPGYMGARRWIKVISGARAGSDGPSDAGRRTGGPPPKDVHDRSKPKSKEKAKPPGARDLMPQDLELRLAEAELTKTIADDLRVLEELERWLLKRIAKEKDVDKRIELLRELKQVRAKQAELRDRGKKPKEKVDDLIPLSLQLALAEAELTKTTNDDLRVLQKIEDYLDARIAKERKINKRLELLAELKQIRDRIAAILAGKGAGKRDKELERQEKQVEDLIGQKDQPGFLEPPGFTGAFGFAFPTGPRGEEGKAKLGKILEPLQFQFDRWKAYWQALHDKRKAEMARLAVAQRNLKRAQAVKPRLRNQRLIKALQAEIRRRKQMIADLTAAMNLALEAMFAINAEMASETQRAAEEEEQPGSTPGESGGDGGEFSGSGGSAPPSSGSGFSESDVQARVEQNILGFLQATHGLRDFMSNIFPLGGRDPLNPYSWLGGSTIHVVNYFRDNPGDPHSWSKQLEFELQAMFGF